MPKADHKEHADQKAVQVVADPVKSALTDAVAAGLEGVLATQAVARLSIILPVYLQSITDLEKAALEFVAYMKQLGPMPEWYAKATAP